MEKVNHPRIGTLPDFGNFKIQEDEWYDRYQGVQELMPYAKAVSAKSHEFDSHGNETSTDYFKMMEIHWKKWQVFALQKYYCNGLVPPYPDLLIIK